MMKAETYTEKLCEPAAEAIARGYFGNRKIDRLPRYLHGKRQGLIKAWIIWQRYPIGDGYGISVKLCAHNTAWSHRPAAVLDTWHTHQL